ALPISVDAPQRRDLLNENHSENASAEQWHSLKVWCHSFSERRLRSGEGSGRCRGGGFLGLSFLLGHRPFAVGTHRSTDIRPIRPHALVSGDDGAKDALNDFFHLCVEQQQLFETAFKDMNSVLEIGLALRRSLVRR